jgi:hypothetical protein
MRREFPSTRVARIASAVALALACVPACTVLHVTAAGPQPVSLNHLPVGSRVIYHYEDTKWIIFGVGEYNVNGEMAEALRNHGGDAVANCEIHAYRNVIDYMCNYPLFGIAGSMHVDIRCDIVKIAGGATAMRDLGYVTIDEDTDAAALLARVPPGSVCHLVRKASAEGEPVSWQLVELSADLSRAGGTSGARP